MSTGYFGKREELYLDKLHSGLITASHILHHHDIFDAFGHISVRNPDDPNSFFLPYNCAPALLKSTEDLVEYKVEDSSPVDKNARPGYAERFIHSEIYKRFPDINAVIHSHCTDVLPYCVNEVPLKPAIHMGGFLGTSVPVWDIESAYTSADKQHDLLVRTVPVGSSLAAAFKPSTSSGFLYSKVRSALPSQITGSTMPKPSNDPDHTVVLMRGHGFTTCADSIEAAVFQAIYTKEVARVQTTALVTQNAHFGSAVEGTVDVQGGGKIKHAKVKTEGQVKYLSDREAADTSRFNRDAMMRPWGLWVREVEVNPLYQNEVKTESS